MKLSLLKEARSDTWHALVAGFEICLQFLYTRSSAFELRIRDSDGADALARAASVGHEKYVREAADVSEADFNAPTEFHSAVDGHLHDDHLVFRAVGPKCVRVTKLTLSTC